MLNELKNLCLIDGISGDEGRVREYIMSKIKDKCEYTVDPMGNLLAFKKGKKEPKNRVMLSAHMDEVGFIVTYICDNGFLKFTNVGGIDPKIAVGRAVRVGENDIKGVIGNKAVHLCHGDEENTVPKLDKLYIDIGAKNKEEATKLSLLHNNIFYFSHTFIYFNF